MEIYIALAVLAVIVAVVISHRKKDKNKPLLSVAEEKPTETVTIEHKTEYDVIIVKDGKKIKGRCKEMAQGLQVFDENGVCVLDVSDRLTRIIGQVTAPSADYDVIKTYTIQAGQKLWWSLNTAADYFEVDPGNLLFGTVGANVTITYLSATSIKVDFHLSKKGDTVILGVY